LVLDTLLRGVDSRGVGLGGDDLGGSDLPEVLTSLHTAFLAVATVPPLYLAFYNPK
jgi:hypothetical protein